MSGSNKSYLPSQRMMPVYTTISPPGSDRPSIPEFPYDPVPSKMLALSKTSPYGIPSPVELGKSSKPSMYALHGADSPKVVGSSSSFSRVQEFPYDPPDKTKPTDYSYEGLTNGGKPGPSPLGYPQGEDKAPTNLSLAYPRMQDFPYGLSGVAMPSYNYSSELYSYVSNGFPRKSRMCSYCGKVFTRSTTRRYHEKRCPLLRAAGSLLKNESNKGAVAAAVAAVKSEGSSHGASYGSSFTPVSSSPRTAFSLAGLSQTYTSTSSTAVDQNRNAVSVMKSEPRDNADESPNNSDAYSTGEVSTSRYTPDYDSGSQALMFSPPTKDRSPVSPTPLIHVDSQADGSCEPAKEGREDSDDEVAGGSEEATYPSSATYQQSRHSSHRSGNNTTQGSSGNGSFDDDEPGEDKDEEITDSKSGANAKKSVLTNKCSICSKTFDFARQLHIHEQLHTKYKPYACRFCGQRFLKVSMRIAHERLHIGEKPYVCAICGLTFTRKYSVRLHMRRRHADGPCLCRYCGKTMYTLQSLKTHLMTHSLPKSEKESLHYIGPGVSERAADTNTSPEAGKSPTSTQPSQEDQMTQISKDMAMAMEMEYAGNSKEKEWCKMCEKEFPKSFMRYHERLHADQKPYECPTCKKRFGYKNNMKSHMKLHAGIKPYQCHICGAKFTRGSTLRRHARRHGIYTESVWDFFVQKGNNAGKVNNAAKNLSPKDQLSRKAEDQTSPEEQRSLAERAHASVTPDNGVAYDHGPYSGAPALATYPGYGPVGSHPERIYHAYPSSSHFNYSNFAASQQGHEPQADALNLSVQKAHSMMQAAAAAAANREAVSDEDADGSDGRNNISAHACTSAGASISVQVNICGCSDKVALLGSLPPFEHRLLSPLNMDGSGTSATSPSLSSGGDNFNQESVSTLMSSGRLFRCIHCDCYFSEYAMYRIHQKLHAKDPSRPFLCPVCYEDCHDKMYYSLHLYEHLRM